MTSLPVPTWGWMCKPFLLFIIISHQHNAIMFNIIIFKFRLYICILLNCLKIIMNVYQATQNTRHCPDHPVERSGSHGLNYKLKCSSTWDTLTAGFFCGTTGTNLCISKKEQPLICFWSTQRMLDLNGQLEYLPALDVTILRS